MHIEIDGRDRLISQHMTTGGMWLCGIMDDPSEHRQVPLWLCSLMDEHLTPAAYGCAASWMASCSSGPYAHDNNIATLWKHLRSKTT